MIQYKFEYFSSNEGMYEVIEEIREWVKENNVTIVSTSHSFGTTFYGMVYSVIITYY